MAYTGRRVIYSDEMEVTDDNITSILEKAYGVHTGNSSEIDYLYNYYKGKQPILSKQPISETRPNNIVLENRANEIVNFKVSYLLGEPIQYVARNKADVSDEINTLNDYVFAEDKASKDKELAEWFTICGTSYRMILPDREEVDESPFEIYTLDPRNTFVVYANDIDKRPLLGVTYVVKQTGSIRFTCYSKDKVYYIERSNEPLRYWIDPVKSDINPLGEIPIIEYPANTSRLGAFETVLTLLDSINRVASDRVDAVQQFVEAIMIFKNVQVDDDVLEQIRTLGGIKVPADGDVSYLVQELSQDSTQTLSDNMYKTVLSIVGMPSIGDGNTSDSSNNGAVILKNGWYGAEAIAKSTELMMKRAEKQFLKIALMIADTTKHVKLALKDIDIRFTRRNYEDLLVKSQVLTTMLANPKIHPRLAYEVCNLFVDSELAYTMSMEYEKENEDKQLAEMEQFKQKSVVEDVNAKQTEEVETEVEE